MRAIVLMFRLIPADLTAKFFWLTAVSVLVGVLEMAGVASIMPFVALMSDPSMLKNSIIGRALPAGYAIPPIHVVGLLVLGLFVLTNLLGLLTVWLSFRFSALLGVRLSENLAHSYFSKGYVYLRSQGASILANNITHETEKLVSCGVLQLCLLVTKSIQVVLVIGLLLVVSPAFAVVVFAVVLSFYAVVYGILRARLARLGGESVNSMAQAMREANELFAAAKELLLRGNARFFIDRVWTSLGKAFKADAVSRMVQVVPKHVIELVAFSALLIIPIYRSWAGEDYRDFLPVMALFAYAGYRILPSAQQVYASFSILKFYDTLAIRFLDVLKEGPGQKTAGGKVTLNGLTDSIRLTQGSFGYSEHNAPVISGVTLCIKRHDKVAIIGPSGAGKSTLLDIVLGLLVPTGGTLTVDGTDLSASGISWDARAVGYVPQSPLIVRATIAQNIAFGVPDEQINLQRCRETAEVACVHDVIDKLPDGYNTFLGDGVSLSGGEIQRLAIARALYFSPALLVLDEPSSALDPMISARLFRNLSAPDFACTVLVVTHDWDSLASFGKIIVVNHGEVVADGDFASVGEYVENLRRATGVSPTLTGTES